MNDVIDKLRLATTKYSLRVIADACGISHERVRQIAFTTKNNITFSTLEKIKSGLDKLEKGE